MAKITKAEWYRRVNASWPGKVPKLEPDEAERAARRLYRFVTKKTWKGPVRITSGRRYTWITRGELVVNPEQGWKSLVHLLSHRLEAYAGAHAHGAEHARLEMRMIREVLRRGWLEGKLRTPEKPPKPEPDPKTVKLVRTEQAIERWEAKQRRAANALKKLRRRLAYYQRAAA